MAVFAIVSNDRWSTKARIMYRVSELCTLVAIELLNIIDEIPAFIIILYFLVIILSLKGISHLVNQLSKSTNENTDDSKSKS